MIANYRYADSPHRIEEGMAGVLHQAPTIRDLNRLWERLLRRQRVAAAPIARDNGDLRLAGEPGLRGRRFAVPEQRDRLATLKIAYDRLEALVAPPCPVVDPNDHGSFERRTAASTARRRKYPLWSARIPLGTPGTGSAVEATCLQALSESVHSGDVVINILARQRDPHRRRRS